MFTWLKGKLGEFHSVLNLPGLRAGRPGLLASRSITYFFLRHNSQKSFTDTSHGPGKPS